MARRKSAVLEETAVIEVEATVVEVEAAVIEETAVVEAAVVDELTEAVVLELAEASNHHVAVEIYNMGEFEVAPAIDRKYVSLYFGLREMYGQAVKLRDKNIDWQTFNSKFEECFGKVEEREYSIEELAQFTWDYFRKTIEEVVEYNKKSLARRNERENEEKHDLVTEELPY